MATKQSPMKKAVKDKEAKKDKKDVKEGHGGMSLQSTCNENV